MARPVIGICTALEQARWGVWEQDAFLLARPYVDAVVRVGGMVVLLPPDPRLLEEPDEALDLIDGLMLAGGVDIDPSTYGASPHAMTLLTVPERDSFELALSLRAIERDLPLLGICRGMQLLNVALGGDLVSHIPDRYGEKVAHRHPELKPVVHEVRIEPDSRLGKILGATELTVHSVHHQAVGRLGTGLRAVAWSPDGVIEAVESANHRFLMAVQWHPELGALGDERQRRLFEALVRRSEAPRAPARAVS